MNLPVLTKYQNALRPEREKTCEMRQAESTTFSTAADSR
jgi:hypothetical protein